MRCSLGLNNGNFVKMSYEIPTYVLDFVETPSEIPNSLIPLLGVVFIELPPEV